MRHILIIFSLYFLSINSYAQIGIENTEDAVMIGNIDMNTVIIHVYQNKEDQWPYKEFSIVKDAVTGEKKVISSSIQGKVSKGGFIIVNGVKSFDEIKRLVSGEKVYDEIVVKDVPEIEEYEQIISDFIRESVIEDAAANEGNNTTELVSENEIEKVSEPKDEANDTEEKTLDLNEAAEKEEPEEEFRAFEGIVQFKEYEAEEEVDETATKDEQISTVSTKTSKSKVSKKVAKSKYKAPKHKSKYGSKKSKKMSSRSRSKKGKKTNCYTF